MGFRWATLFGLLLALGCSASQHSPAAVSGPSELAAAADLAVVREEENPRLRGSHDSRQLKKSDDDFITENIYNYRAPEVVMWFWIVVSTLIILIVCCVLLSCGITPDLMVEVICMPCSACFEIVHTCIEHPACFAVFCCWWVLLFPDEKSKPAAGAPQHQVQQQINVNVQMAPAPAEGTPIYIQPIDIPVAEAVPGPTLQASSKGTSKS